MTSTLKQGVSTVNQIFVNLTTNNLEKAMTFWKALGFSFNPQFTDENAACLVLGENIFVMLLIPTFFTRFTKKEITNAFTAIEAINCISIESRAKVNEMFEKALAAGGKEVRPADDYGWMYSRSFEDIDGHQWEVMYADLTKLPKKE